MRSVAEFRISDRSLLGSSRSKRLDNADRRSSQARQFRKRCYPQDRTGAGETKSLSSSARSVKVMAVGNLVVLRGPVRSESERKTVLACAKKYAGDNNVWIRSCLEQKRLQ